MVNNVLDNPVKVAERRMTERVRQKWTTVANGRLPSLIEIEELNLGLDREYCFAVDLRLSDILPYFTFVGEKLCHYTTLYPMDDPHREKTFLDTVISKMDEAALSRKPVADSGITRIGDGRRVPFRSILLPVSENGVDVSHIFGAARGKGL